MYLLHLKSELKKQNTPYMIPDYGLFRIKLLKDEF